MMKNLVVHDFQEEHLKIHFEKTRFRLKMTAYNAQKELVVVDFPPRAQKHLVELLIKEHPEDNYVRLSDVKELLELIKERDSYSDTSVYNELDRKVQRLEYLLEVKAI